MLGALTSNDQHASTLLSTNLSNSFTQSCYTFRHSHRAHLRATHTAWLGGQAARVSLETFIRFRLSNHPLSTRRHPVACWAAACLVACSYCSDSLHFGVCLDLLCCCCRRVSSGFGELSAELELWDDARGVPVSDRHRGLTRVGADRRERGAAPCWLLCQ